MVNKNFLVGIGVIVLLAIVFSSFNFTGNVAQGETCDEAGMISEGFYCSATGVYEPLVVDEGSCLNEYECANGSCVEGICQSKYGGIVDTGDALDESDSFVTKIWDFLKGKKSAPNNGDDDDGDDDSPGGRGGCYTVWSCTDWSNLEEICGTRTCTDLNKCDRETRVKPPTVKVCPGAPAYCGDDECNLDEDSDSCPDDCPVQKVSKCGDDVCSSDENESGDCPDDCGSTWKAVMWILLIVVVLSLIGFGIFWFIKRSRNNSESNAVVPGAKPGIPPKVGIGVPQKGLAMKRALGGRPTNVQQKKMVSMPKFTPQKPFSTKPSSLVANRVNSSEVAKKPVGKMKVPAQIKNMKKPLPVKIAAKKPVAKVNSKASVISRAATLKRLKKI
jgi:hypothetical protein